MPNSTLARVGAFFTLLLALWGLWPPFVVWWPPHRLFWPIVLGVGALLVLRPDWVPASLRQIGAHRNFGVLLATIVWANFWVHSGIIWMLAAVPLALAFWRGPNWTWNPMTLAPNRRLFAAAVTVALICLRLNWTTVAIGSGSYFTGGMNYGLNTYNAGTGYYEYGWQYNPMQNLVPGLTFQYPFAGTQLRGGIWATLICVLLALLAARRDLSIGRREVGVGLILVALWWAWNGWSGAASQLAAWGFAGCLGAMLFAVKSRIQARGAAPNAPPL